MNLQFERATIEDVDRLIEVQNLAFYQDYVKYGTCPGYGHTQERMASIITAAQDYKIVCDGVLVGNIIVRELESGCFRLSGLCVIPAYENRGIGQQALRFIEREFPQARLWCLDTPADKYRNHYFYEKMGYVRAGEQVDGTVTLIMYEKEMTGAGAQN